MLGAEPIRAELAGAVTRGGGPPGCGAGHAGMMGASSGTGGRMGVERQRRIVVAVDGPSGSGKSTVSRRLAMALDARYLDTGAMYRAATWAVLRSGVDPQDAEAVTKIVRDVQVVSGIDPVDPQISVDGVRVDAEIRGRAVTAAVSAVSAVPAVRAMLVARQREIVASVPRIVVEGRDIGAVVAPDADLKVFLTASAAERARRRSAENAADPVVTAADLDRRDRMDSSRAADPFRQAPDAVVLDTTAIGIEEAVRRLLDLAGGAVPR